MVNAVLERLYREQEVVHRNGRRKPICPPGLSVERGAYLFELIRDRRPERTLEIGFAYGISTLHICEALRQNGHGHHVVIDPLEHTRFDGLGLRHVEEAGLSRWMTFYEEPSEYCLARLAREGLRVDVAFDDSGHLFDHVVTEFLFLARLLRLDGLLVVDDVNLPGVGRAVDFLETNRGDFEDAVTGKGRGLIRRMLGRRVPPPPAHFRVFRKIADEDPRDWKDFVPF
ncbi:MAG TPA: class I SAM-dependent methyltransferase [Candidatus Binatia bacterium]|nr:class I SAM-dependent methyltransferase [Candidatus Binatia bacterium]